MLLSENEVSGAYMLFFQRNYILHCPRNLEAVTCSPPVLRWLCRRVEVGFLLKTYSGILINFLPDKKNIYIILERGGRTIGEIRLINTYLCILLLEWIATHMFYFGNWQGDVGCSATWLSQQYLADLCGDFRRSFSRVGAWPSAACKPWAAYGPRKVLCNSEP